MRRRGSPTPMTRSRPPGWTTRRSGCPTRARRRRTTGTSTRTASGRRRWWTTRTAAARARAPIGGIGIELWTMQSGILFDNIVLAGSADVAAGIAASAFEPRAAAEKASKAQAAQQEGGVMAQLKLYAGAAFAWCLENAMLVGATLCLGVLPLLLFCCVGGKKKEEEEDPAE